MHRLKLTRINRIKLKTSTRIPAQLIAGTGIDITRETGEYTVAVNDDYVALATEAATAAQEAAEAAETAAETASTAAVAAAAEAVAAAAATNSKLAVYNTFALAEASSPTAAIEKIRILGYYAPGDGGDGEYRLYTGSDPSHGANILCANGTKFTLDHPLEVYAEQFGAVGDYDIDAETGTDDTVAIQKWADYTATTKRLLGKAYLITETVTFPPDYTYEGIPGKSLIKGQPVASGGSYTGDDMVLCAGASDPEALPDLNGDLAPSQIYVEFVSTVAGEDLEAGDILIIYNTVDGSFSEYRDEYRAGEMHPITSYGDGSGTNTRVFIADRIHYNYAEADVEVYFFKKKGVTIRNIEFRAPGDGGVLALRLKLLTGVVLDNVSASIDTSAVSTAGEFDRCYDVRGSIRGYARGADGATDQYAWVIAHCTQVVLNPGGDSSWHPFAIGGYDGDTVGHKGSVPNRSIRFVGGQFWSSGDSAPGTDVHGNSEDVVFDSCVIQNGAKFGGKDVTYRRCMIYGGDFANGSIVYGAELRGGVYTLDECILETYGNPSVISRGVIDIGGNGDAFGPSSKEEATIRILNCMVRVNSDATSLLRMSNYSTTLPLNVDIDGITVSGGAELLSLVRYAGEDAAVEPATFISVHRVMGLRDGATLLTAASTTPYDSETVMRMPVQSGTTAIATANGVASTVASPVDFKWNYPDVPIGHLSMLTSTGVPTQNSKGILPYFHSLSATTIRPGIASHDGANWNGIVSVELHWSAGPGIKGYK
jgi:hypothetical protein